MTTNNTSYPTVKACKNCSHFAWSEQLCHLHEIYSHDEDVCPDFDNIYDTSPTTKKEVTE